MFHSMNDGVSPGRAIDLDTAEFFRPGGLGRSILRHEVGVLWRRRRLIGACLFASLAAVTAYNYGARPLYESVAVISLEVAGSVPLQVQASQDPVRRSVALAEQVAVLKSQELAYLVVSKAEPPLTQELSRGPVHNWLRRVLVEGQFRLGLAATPSGAVADQVEAFRSRLVVLNEGTSWVRIEFRAYDPQVARSALNRLIEVYVAETEKQAQLIATQHRSKLEEEVETRKEGVAGALTNLARDRKWAGLQDAETNRQFLEKQLAALQDALVVARQTRLSRKVLMADAERRSDGQLLTIEMVRSDPEVSALTARIADLEARKAKSLATLGVLHPEVTTATEELVVARKALSDRLSTLRQTIEREYRIAEQQEATLGGNLRSVEKRLAELRPQGVEYSLVQKQTEARERAVGDLIERSVREPDETLFLSPRVVQAAQPAPLVSPHRSRNVLYGLGAGLAVGVALAWLLRNLDETFSTPEQLREELGVQCLGLVPRINPAEVNLLRDSPIDFRLVEAYRVIRTNLSASYNAADHVFVLITSTSPNEGKTTTSLGVALAFAASGARTLLVDGDIRRATTSRQMNLYGAPGLLDLAQGQPEAACVHSTRFANLDCLPAGGTQAHSAEILSRETFRQSILPLAQKYAWIICDAPPVLAVADAAILSRVADAVVLVVRAGQAPVRAVHAAMRQLVEVGAKLRGAVLSAADLQADSYYYRYYYSGYYANYDDPASAATVPEAVKTPETVTQAHQDEAAEKPKQDTRSRRRRQKRGAEASAPIDRR